MKQIVNKRVSSQKISVNNVVDKVATLVVTATVTTMIHNSMHVPLHAIYERVKPHIVTISTKELQKDPFSARTLIETSLGTGTGFWYKDNKHVITNAHVVEGAFNILVDDAEANLVGVDVAHDIAVLEIDTNTSNPHKTYPPLKKCTSPATKGQSVIAIGNPYGFKNSITAGIISGTDRGLDASAERMLVNLLQTDAAINPGNSGGPLMNAEDGCLLGMNTAIVSPSGSSAGVGFALPIDLVYRTVDAIINHVDDEKFQLGITFVPDKYAEMLGMEGVIVADVIPNSIAAKLGLQGTHRDDFGRPFVGDVIIGINGKKVKTAVDIYQQLEVLLSGNNIQLDVLTAHGMEHYVVTYPSK